MNSEIAKSRIGEVIRIDTVTSTQADFLATHVPVQNIHIRKKWDSKTDKVMSEEKVFNKYVLNTENEHQFIIVIGSSGAGKSHLIRWFAARLEQSAPENEVVLFVRRSDNSLKGTIKQLLELPEVANIPNKAVYDRLVRATYIHQQVEESQADRVERFIRVWGNASDLEYEENGIKYLGGMPIGFFDDLGIPTFTGRKGDKPVKVSVEPIKQLSDSLDITQPPEPIVSKVDPAMADFLLGQRILQIWIDGGELNVGTTTKDVINITKARDEINKRFLISAINWQIEGVSLDNLNRVKAAKDFVGFERQKRGVKNALTILPADRETQGVLEAFLAYVTLGNGSWNFDNSAMMVYRVQTWVEKWKKTIIQTVNVFDNQPVDYQDCAIATEMIREIMQGVFTGTKVEGIPATNLMAKNLKKAVQNSHCTEWNSLVNMLLNNDEKVKDVITQYYNIIQGNLKSSQVFIRATEFNSDVRKVQKAKLLIPDEQILLTDPISQRREIREIYEKIYTRIPKVAEAEKEKANRLLEQIGMYLDYEDMLRLY